jgi:hypothetical protein
LSGTTVNGQAIQITGLSNTDLGGTPMVAGDPAGLDPTAVTLVNFGAAETAGTNLLWVALLTVGLLLGLGTLRWSRRRSTHT